MIAAVTVGGAFLSGVLMGVMGGFALAGLMKGGKDE